MTEPITTQAVDLTGLAVATGRIEEKLNAMSEKEGRTGERLDKVEERLSSIELNLAANVRPKTPWYTWVAGVGAVLLLALNGFLAFDLLTSLATLTP